MRSDSPPQGYSASLEGAAYYLLPDPGYLWIMGKDRASFLQRQTTNDTRLLEPGSALLTVLTDPAARILNVFTLLLEPGSEEAPGEDAAIGVVTLPGLGGQAARFLKSRIFFNDQVSLEDKSEEFVQLDLDGPKAAAVLAGLGLEPPGAGQVIRLDYEGSSLNVIGPHAFPGPGYRLLGPRTIEEKLLARLHALGAEPLSPEAFLARRVEAGLPASGAELRDTFTPLETGLERAISSTKGCFTGQEVLARQITYDKITQRLSGLRLETAVEPGRRLWAGGKPAGEITSSVFSPRFGWISLAIVKRPHFEPGARLYLDQEGAEPAGTVVSLPFDA